MSFATNSLPELQHIIGQRVIVSGNEVEVGGILQFVGYNKFFPNWGLNCTVDRMPGIKINNISQIKLHEIKRIFK